MILEDSRQKPDKNAHIREQLEQLGFTVDRTKVYCGDYTFATDQRVCVDTKQDLQEVVGNVTKQHERFREECERAQRAGIKLIILVQDSKIKDVNGVFGWFNVRRKWSKGATSGRTLAKIMLSMTNKYGVEWKFSTKDKMGETIVKLLKGEIE